MLNDFYRISYMRSLQPMFNTNGSYYSYMYPFMEFVHTLSPFISFLIDTVNLFCENVAAFLMALKDDRRPSI